MALEFFKRSGTQKDLQVICDFYRDHKELLTASELISIFELLDEGRINLRIYMYDHFYKVQKALPEQLDLMTYMLKKRNHLDSINFNYLAMTKELDLSSNPKLSRLNARHNKDIKGFCLLKYLDIKDLNLSFSGVKNLRDLEGIALHSLDLRHTPVKHLNDLRKIASLRRVILAPSQKHLTQGDWPFEFEFVD